MTAPSQSHRNDDMDDDREEEGLVEAIDLRIFRHNQNVVKRVMGAFYGNHPSDEQMEYFKRGGR